MIIISIIIIFCFICICFSIMQDILTTASHSTILSLFPYPFTQICCFSISVYIRTGFPSIGPNAAYQYATSKGKNYHVKHGRDNQVGAKESQEQAKKSAIQLLPLLGILQIPNLNSHYIYAYRKLSANSWQDQ